jgi:hypothetical protein
VGAAADCEAIGPGWLGQPVNSLTTLAFIVAGVLVLVARPDRRWVGTALAATGAGSLLFHGPMPPWSEWAHDVTLAWLLLVIAGTGTRWERQTHLPGLAGLALLFAVAPVSADPLAVVLSVVAVLSILRRDRSPATVWPMTLIGAAAIFGRLGASGGPLCDPDSLLQLHGIWHLAAAAGVAWWALATTRPIESPALR